MPGPFYNAIKGTTAGTPGTGAFTPNAASAGFLAWSAVPTGWIGLVRYEDGSAWELQYSYWNGTTLSRSATAQFVSSSTGSALTLTSAATAAMIADANEVGADYCGYPARGFLAQAGSTSTTALGLSTIQVTGTAAAAALASTNALTAAAHTELTSATTANAVSGWGQAAANGGIASSTAGIGGWLFNCRFGATQLPTGPRFAIGMSSATFGSLAGEPSASTANNAIIGKDSTDTNLQLLVNSGAGSGTKTDTGIAVVVNGWYDVSLWSEPGSLTVYCLLLRLDTGAIFYGSTATDVPVTGTALRPNCHGTLNGSNTGTAIILAIGHMLIRNVA